MLGEEKRDIQNFSQLQRSLRPREEHNWTAWKSQRFHGSINLSLDQLFAMYNMYVKLPAPR